MGRSKLIPRKVHKDETASDRHHRRWTFNMKQVAHMTIWCSQYGIEITVTNDGHHWKFERDEKSAEWWPSSAKLVFDKHWKRGLHCHDIEQLKTALKKRWKLK